MTIIICVVLAIVAIDAIWSRTKLHLRTRAAQAVTQRPSHHLTGSKGSGGWHPLQQDEKDIHTEQLDENLFQFIARGRGRGR
jgi:hypothetical protein